MPIPNTVSISFRLNNAQTATRQLPHLISSSSSSSSENDRRKSSNENIDIIITKCKYWQIHIERESSLGKSQSSIPDQSSGVNLLPMHCSHRPGKGKTIAKILCQIPSRLCARSFLQFLHPSRIGQQPLVYRQEAEANKAHQLFEEY